MRNTLLLSTLVALAANQSIDLSLISNAPAVTITVAPVTGTIQSVSAQNSAQASSVGVAAVQSNAIAERDLNIKKRDGTCATQPAGTGPIQHFNAEVCVGVYSAQTSYDLVVGNGNGKGKGKIFNL